MRARSTVFLASLVVACAAAGSRLREVACRPCHSLPGDHLRIGPLSVPLAAVGLCFYVLVLMLWFTRRRPEAFFVVTLLAGVHVALVTFLLQSTRPCVPCLLAALGVCVAAIAGGTTTHTVSSRWAFLLTGVILGNIYLFASR